MPHEDEVAEPGDDLVVLGGASPGIAFCGAGAVLPVLSGWVMFSSHVRGGMLPGFGVEIGSPLRSRSVGGLLQAFLCERCLVCVAQHGSGKLYNSGRECYR